MIESARVHAGIADLRRVAPYVVGRADRSLGSEPSPIVGGIGHLCGDAHTLCCAKYGRWRTRRSLAGVA